MHQWVSYQGRVPYPRPGMCPSKTFGTFSSTKDFPDDVIQFARNHPLMYNSVLPIGGRPLFLQVGANYTFTQIATDRVAAADGHYDVLFIGTDAGTVLKVISVPKGSRPSAEGLLLEELHVFEDSAAVTSMQISSKRAVPAARRKEWRPQHAVLGRLVSSLAAGTQSVRRGGQQRLSRV